MRDPGLAHFVLFIALKKESRPNEGAARSSISARLSVKTWSLGYLGKTRYSLPVFSRFDPEEDHHESTEDILAKMWLGVTRITLIGAKVNAGVLEFTAKLLDKLLAGFLLRDSLKGFAEKELAEGSLDDTFGYRRSDAIKHNKPILVVVLPQLSNALLLQLDELRLELFAKSEKAVSPAYRSATVHELLPKFTR